LPVAQVIWVCPASLDPPTLTVGWKPRKNVVVSVSADVPIVDDREQYDWQVEFRVGFFL
jgi:hypothetical protein